MGPARRLSWGTPAGCEDLSGGRGVEAAACVAEVDCGARYTARVRERCLDTRVESAFAQPSAPTATPYDAG